MAPSRLRAFLLAALIAALAVPAAADARSIEWSGYTWWVRENLAATSMPGPNLWDGSAKSVWVDRKGDLHMKVRYDKANRRWVSSEIGTNWWFGPGRYEWVVQSPGDQLDRNVTVGMYNYLDATHEIDIELARWGRTAAQDPTNAQYAVQPWDLPGNQVRFTAPAGVATYSFDWSATAIGFDGRIGSWASPWLYTGPTISTDWSAPVRINVWQYKNLAPASGRDVEVVFRSFRYTPPA